MNAMSKWIDVKDRLPEIRVDVLVYEFSENQRSMWVAHLVPYGHWIGWRGEYSYDDTPTHWMPLPEPPSETKG